MFLPRLILFFTNFLALAIFFSLLNFFTLSNLSALIFLIFFNLFNFAARLGSKNLLAFLISLFPLLTIPLLGPPPIPNIPALAPTIAAINATFKNLVKVSAKFLNFAAESSPKTSPIHSSVFSNTSYPLSTKVTKPSSNLPPKLIRKSTKAAAGLRKETIWGKNSINLKVSHPIRTPPRNFLIPSKKLSLGINDFGASSSPSLSGFSLSFSCCALVSSSFSFFSTLYWDFLAAKVPFKSLSTFINFVWIS